MGIFFVAFIGADYNRCSEIYKITRFNYWVMVVLEGGNVGRKGGYQNRTSANKGDGGVSKFWSFCENVIIE